MQKKRTLYDLVTSEQINLLCYIHIEALRRNGINITTEKAALNFIKCHPIFEVGEEPVDRLTRAYHRIRDFENQLNRLSNGSNEG